MRGQEADRRARRPAEERVVRRQRLDLLIVAVAAGIVVRPGDGRGADVVDNPSRLVRFWVAGLEAVELADAAELQEALAQVLVVTGHEQAAAPATESLHALGVAIGDGVGDVHGEQPELIDVGVRQPGQVGVVARGVRLPVARRNLEQGAVGTLQAFQVGLQQREPPDVPVVGRGRDGGLDEDAAHARSPAVAPHLGGPQRLRQGVMRG